MVGTVKQSFRSTVKEKNKMLFGQLPLILQSLVNEGLCTNLGMYLPSPEIQAQPLHARKQIRSSRSQRRHNACGKRGADVRPNLQLERQGTDGRHGYR